MFLVPCHHEKDPILAGNMKQTIMREAAEDARKSNEEATERYFNQMLMEVRKIAAF